MLSNCQVRPTMKIWFQYSDCRAKWNFYLNILILVIESYAEHFFSMITDTLLWFYTIDKSEENKIIETYILKTTTLMYLSVGHFYGNSFVKIQNEVKLSKH